MVCVPILFFSDGHDVERLFLLQQAQDLSHIFIFKPADDHASHFQGNGLEVNILGRVASLIRHFAPAMVKRDSGVIVNFSSGWGRSTDPLVAPYCASKWAMEGLTQALAQEIPQGMAAIPLNPGIIDTDMLRSCFGADAGNYPTAVEWAQTAVPWLLGLGPQDNGRSLTVGEPH